MAILNDAQVQAWLDVGNGNGNGISSGIGNGMSNGYGNGRGNGRGMSSGIGNGMSSGYGNGRGNGYGIGRGSGNGIKELDEHKLYYIDNVLTAILSIKGNIASGFVLEHNVIKKECYVVRENGKFAHGKTLRDAFISLQEKLYDDSTEKERIEIFKAKFPKYDTEYANEDLFAYHHVLTGSCRMGRENFCANHGIDMNGKTSVREFVELTKGDYGGEIIKKLPNAYGVQE